MSSDPAPSAQPDPRETRTFLSAAGAAIQGQFIGPYQLIRELGEGGMGLVYEAHQLQPIRRDVALKVIKPGMDSRQVIARFESERQALAIMDHPNIARVFDAGTTPAGLPYFVMELVAGVPITQYCDSRRLTIRDRIELFLPVCQAIQHAHQKGVIHRDLKPSNILVKQEEGGPAAKVIDFGLAKALGPQMDDATAAMTNLGMVVGTLNYMSPEQAELGRRDVDTRSDVYSLGAVLYELLTGSTPLDQTEHASYLDALRHIREKETPPPSTRLRRSGSSAEIAAQRQTDPARLPKLLHRELDWIAMKALEKDRTRRYETVNGLARDLRRYLDGEPVDAAPPSAAYRLGKVVRKHRLWLGAAAAFVAVLIGAVVVSARMAVRARQAQAEAIAVSDFLRNDVLAQASAVTQASPNTKPDRDLKVRTALDRAAARVEGKFPGQPLVEASIRETIGKTYRDLGLYEEAQRQIERTVALRARTLGENHPDTLAARSELGDLEAKQGRYPEAESILAGVLKAHRRGANANDYQTQSTMLRLADVYKQEAKYGEAEALFTSVLGARRSAYGEEHAYTLDVMNMLAGVYRVQGKYAPAETLLEKVVSGQKRVSGPEHPDTLIAMNNLAVVYLQEKKYPQAEALSLETLPIRRRVSGDDHPDTLAVMNNLAVAYQREGKFAQAEPLAAEAMEKARRVLGEEHPNTLTFTSALANIYRGEGKYAEAEPLYKRALELIVRVRGPENPMTLTTEKNLGILYRDERRFAESEKLLTKAYEAQKRVLGEQHPDTVTTAGELAKLYQVWGKGQTHLPPAVHN